MCDSISFMYESRVSLRVRVFSVCVDGGAKGMVGKVNKVNKVGIYFALFKANSK
jgi:hypothetical protein